MLQESVYSDAPAREENSGRGVGRRRGGRNWNSHLAKIPFCLKRREIKNRERRKCTFDIPRAPCEFARGARVRREILAERATSGGTRREISGDD